MRRQIGHLYYYEWLKVLLFCGVGFCSVRITTALTTPTIPMKMNTNKEMKVNTKTAFFSRQSYYVLHNSNNNNNNNVESLIQAATISSQGQLPLGGDFAGLAATFHPGNGSFLPIPDSLIPPSLLEWGQEPKCLEVLVSEDIIVVDNKNDLLLEDNTSKTLTRTTTTVLPDTGCSIDNLETLKVIDEIDLESQWSSSSSTTNEEEGKSSTAAATTTTVVGLQYPLNEESNELRVETIFGLEADDGGQYRMRVAIDVVPSPPDTFGISSPMVLTLERRTNAVSSGGTIADGGGLDGRTVSMLLGERLSRSKTFVDDPPIGDNYESDAFKHVALPGNVNIAYGWLTEDDWVLQVSHVGPNGLRRVVSRQFTVMDNGELDFEIRSWLEDPQEVSVQYK
jgi:hypothetical protein